MTTTSIQSAQLEICNRRGLHARASAKFVETASRFDASIKVSKDGLEVVGTSIMGLMLLAASKGQHIEVKTSGPQAAEALEALRALVAARFDED